MTRKEIIAAFKAEGEAAGISRQDLNARFVYTRREGAAPSLHSLTKAELTLALNELREAAQGFTISIDGKTRAFDVVEEHDWRLMYDGPEAAPCWSKPESGRWCGGCGIRVGSLGATESAPPCQGKPEDRVLTVKGIKSFKGMEGYGFNATLYRDGKKLGLVIDEGNGGSFLYRCFKNYAEQAEYEQWARLQPDGGGFDPLDTILGDLVGQYEETAKLKRWCKKKTVVKLKGDPEDAYSIWKVSYTPEFAAKLRKANDVVEIVNERFLVKA